MNDLRSLFKILLTIILPHNYHCVSLDICNIVSYINRHVLIVSFITNYLCFIHCQLWQARGDPVLHIDLRRWADICVIAPLDANTLAKIASGICDNLLVWQCLGYVIIMSLNNVF